MNISKKEKRLHERFLYDNPIMYIVMGSLKLPHGLDIKEGMVKDLSNGGMKIIIEKNKIAKGVILKVLLPISTVKVNVPVLAEVRWIKKLPNGDYQAGLAFLA